MHESYANKLKQEIGADMRLLDADILIDITGFTIISNHKANLDQRRWVGDWSARCIYRGDCLGA